MRTINLFLTGVVILMSLSGCSSTGGWMPLLCTMNCTVATELSRDLFDMDVKQIDAAGATETLYARPTMASTP